MTGLLPGANNSNLVNLGYGKIDTGNANKESGVYKISSQPSTVREATPNNESSTVTLDSWRDLNPGNSGLGLLPTVAENSTPSSNPNNVLKQTRNSAAMSFGDDISGWMMNGQAVGNKNNNQVRNTLANAVLGGNVSMSPWASRQQQQTVDAIAQSNPEWESQIKDYINRVALSRLAGVNPHNSYAGDEFNSYDDYYKANNQNWQQQANQLREAYLSQNGGTFDWNNYFGGQ